MSFIVKPDNTIYCGIEIFCRGFVFLPYTNILRNFSIRSVITTFLASPKCCVNNSMFKSGGIIDFLL